MGCGDSIAENGTYFESSSSVVGQCNLRVCPCNDNICQLRLDFVSFGMYCVYWFCRGIVFGALKGKMFLKFFFENYTFQQFDAIKHPF